MPVHVYIATTLGPVKVQSFRSIDAKLLSNVGIDGTLGREAAISSAYHEFVKPGVGLIADEFGGGSWRMDISEEIDEGRSWQLGVYIAHWLNHRGDLAAGDLTPGDHVVWATGEVSVHRQVRHIEGLQEKIDWTQSELEEWKAAGIGVTALAPEVDVRNISVDNAPKLHIDDLDIAIAGVSHLDEALDVIRSAAFRVAPAEPEIDSEYTRRQQISNGTAAGPQLEPGEIVLGQYEITSLLGAGGMSEVYRAVHLGLNRQPRAIKVMQGNWSVDDTGTELMIRETEALLRVNHPAVVRCHDLHTDGEGRCYLVMEMLEGISLAEAIKKGPLSVGEVAALGARLTAGLVAAHAVGVVHRDISPDNIVLRNGNVDEATLIDFGIAKMPQSGEGTVLEGFKGKYSYASPEQLGYFDGKVEGTSDLYSLGLVLAEAATGKSLEMGKTMVEAIQARESLHVLPADIPLGLRSTIEPLLAFDPADRPPNPTGLFAVPESAPDATRTDKLPGKTKRTWLLAGGAGLAAVAITVSVALSGGGTPSDDTDTPSNTPTGVAYRGCPGASAAPTGIGSTANGSTYTQPDPPSPAPDSDDAGFRIYRPGRTGSARNPKARRAGPGENHRSFDQCQARFSGRTLDDPQGG